MRGDLVRIPVAVVVFAMSVLVACSGLSSPSPAGPSTASASAPSVAFPSATTTSDLLRDLLALLPQEGTYVERLAACLRAAGWEAEVGDDGESVSFDHGTEANRDEFRQDKRACDVVVPPPPVVPLTDSEIRAMYAYWLEMRDCLANLGYLTSDPPMEDEFVRTWATGPWSPYLDLPGRALDRADDRCPQSPAWLDDR
jgi:hypothetical protein